MSKIYIASKKVISKQFGHLYLVYEDDAGDQFIVRGGPVNDLGLTDPNEIVFDELSLEVNIAIANSEDGGRDQSLEPGQNLPDPVDRNFTELDLGGRDAATVWDGIVQFSNSMGLPGSDPDTILTFIDYNLLSSNSNSFITTVLSRVGIDVNDRISAMVNPPNFLPAKNSLLDAPGNDDFIAFSGQEMKLLALGGQNTITVQDGATLEIFGNDVAVNTIVLEGVDPNEAFLFRTGNSLEIMSSANAQIAHTIVSIPNHFLDGGLSGVTFANAQSIDLSNLSSDDLLPFAPLSVPQAVADGLLAFQATLAVLDPLAVDMDRDGMITQTGPNRVYFDLDNDGQAEAVSWIGPGDGWLARDVNANGTIDNASELFGSATENGFDKLAELDDNADGVVDANDAAFDDLVVWQDKNQDQTLYNVM